MNLKFRQLQIAWSPQFSGRAGPDMLSKYKDSSARERRLLFQEALQEIAHLREMETRWEILRTNIRRACDDSVAYLDDLPDYIRRLRLEAK